MSEQFILKCIDSIAHLEALLLLRREPRSAWTAATVAGRLYIEESEAKTVLKRLCAEGLITAGNGNYRFNGERSGKEELVNRRASCAVAMASFVASLFFFLRFWRGTRDLLFFFFAIAFAVDALTRVALALIPNG